MNWLNLLDNQIIIDDSHIKNITEFKDISQFPEGTYGFVYHIDYDDGTSYIGKKNLFSYKKVHKLKNGNWPKGVISVTEAQKNTGKGKRLIVYTGKIESNWKTYQGSHTDCKNKTVVQKYIVAIARNSLELTYLEAKYLFAAGVLENKDYLNDNILGRFYKAHLV